MSYTALYRKWRPDTFNDVKGQDHIVTTLQNQIEADRIGHAYLFCGTRGTGKTTVAKILARAVNCEHPIGGSPCGECTVCRAISSGASLNVVEIDAASNNGVDNIRQIREEVQYRPTEGRYKVYIIDEVHMLSIGAFNALLKTLEEPPSYVIFILATTEAHKIPVTIVSRCQRYDFKRINVETIHTRLRELVDKEGTLIEDKALVYIAKLADGAMRDALSLLDQCTSFYMDKEMKYDDVLEILGTLDTEVFSELLRDIINEKAAVIIRKLDDLILQGRDLTQFVSDFIWYLRNLLLLKASREAIAMIDMSSENIEHLMEETVMVSEEQIMRYIRILSELSAGMKFSTQKRVMTEVALIKMMKPQMEKDITSITERINRLEELVKEKEELIALTAIRPAGAPVTIEEPEAIIRKTRPVINAIPDDIRKVAENWRGIIGQAENIYTSYLKQLRITTEDDKLILVAENEFVYNFMLKDNHTQYVKALIEKTINKKINLEFRKTEENVSFDESFTDIEKYVKIDIAIED